MTDSLFARSPSAPKVYLLDDRLCWAPEEGSVADVRYISLDR